MCKISLIFKKISLFSTIKIAKSLDEPLRLCYLEIVNFDMKSVLSDGFICQFDGPLHLARLIFRFDG